MTFLHYLLTRILGTFYRKMLREYLFDQMLWYSRGLFKYMIEWYGENNTADILMLESVRINP